MEPSKPIDFRKYLDREVFYMDHPYPKIEAGGQNMVLQSAERKISALRISTKGAFLLPGNLFTVKDLTIKSAEPLRL
jgi:hypothetical protein